jgi:hypothetical protein
MTEKECCNRLKDLRQAELVYTKMLSDKAGAFFGDISVMELLKRVRKEKLRLEELLYNCELEDSEETFIKYF